VENFKKPIIYCIFKEIIRKNPGTSLEELADILLRPSPGHLLSHLKRKVTVAKLSLGI